jgi:hypothetical protein
MQNFEANGFIITVHQDCKRSLLSYEGREDLLKNADCNDDLPVAHLEVVCRWDGGMLCLKSRTLGLDDF